MNYLYPNTQGFEYADLYDLLPDANPSYNWRDGSMRSVEREQLTPALEALGYEVSDWFDGERDSFGPLSRAARITKDGITKIVSYG
jgi:hypothetical protein